VYTPLLPCDESGRVRRETKAAGEHPRGADDHIWRRGRPGLGLQGSLLEVPCTAANICHLKWWAGLPSTEHRDLGHQQDGCGEEG